MKIKREWNQKVRNTLAEDGIELTPDQVDEERSKAYATIREEMAKLGHKVPDTDEELFVYLRFNFMIGDAPDEVAGRPREELAAMVERIVRRTSTPRSGDAAKQ